MARRNSRDALPSLREQLAQEAAKLMSEHGIRDYSVAKRKAADRLGVSARGALPSNAQIERRLAQRQRIFEPDQHPDRLQSYRAIALTLMEQLSPFQPRLAGAVLNGTATNNSVIEIHAFADSPETVFDQLRGQGLSIRSSAKRYRLTHQTTRLMPVYRFEFDGAEVMLVVFAENGIRQAPLSPVDQKPMSRASIKNLRALAAMHAAGKTLN